MDIQLLDKQERRADARGRRVPPAPVRVHEERGLLVRVFRRGTSGIPRLMPSERIVRNLREERRRQRAEYTPVRELAYEGLTGSPGDDVRHVVTDT